MHSLLTKDKKHRKKKNMSEKRETETANRTGTKRERDHYVGWQK